MEKCRYLRKQSKYRELKEAEKECLQLMKGCYSDKSEQVLDLKRSLGDTLKVLKEYEEAKEVNREIIYTLAIEKGIQHKETLNAKQEEADLLARMEQKGEAEKIQ